MKDMREEWYEATEKVAVTVADVTGVATQLARGHLAGPTAAHYLAKALAAAALLGAETGGKDETLSVQMKCAGPLGGFNVECTADGTLRGYTERKILDDFDGLGAPDDRRVLGERRLQVTRSVPGKILSQGLSNSLDGYLAGSLQRRAVIHLEASVADDATVTLARGLLVEALPDAASETFSRLSAFRPESLAVSSRNLLVKLGLARAALKRTTPLAFACRCSAERAAAMLAALPDAERATLPPTVDVTCHMCGRTWSVRTGA